MTWSDAKETIGGLMILWNKDRIEGRLLNKTRWTLTLWYDNRFLGED